MTTQTQTRAMVATSQVISAVRHELDNREDQLVALLGRDIPVERFITVALHAINGNTDIQRCTPLSIVEAIRESATLRLEPTGLMGDAYLVRYGDKARLMPGYRGLMKLARRSGEIKAMDAQVVYEKDRFAIHLGTESAIEHVPALNDRGAQVGAYAWARLTSGELVTEWMSLADLEQVRKSSRAASDGPWVSWWAEMARKSALRRLLKRLPLTAEAERALSLDAEAEQEATLPQQRPSPAVLAARQMFTGTAPAPAEAEAPPTAGMSDAEIDAALDEQEAGDAS